VPKPVYYVPHPQAHAADAIACACTSEAEAVRLRGSYNALGARLEVSRYVALSDVVDALLAADLCESCAGALASALEGLCATVWPRSVNA